MALGKNPSQATQTECLVTQVVLCLSHANRKVNALIDCGAHQNFLSQKFVLEEGLIADPTTMGAHTIDGHRVAIYGRHAVETQATDMDGVTRSTEQEFLATDCDDYPVILGLPWMEAADPDCHWRAKTWRYRSEEGELRIEEVKAKKLKKISRTQPVFAIFLMPVVSKRIARLRQAILTKDIPKAYRVRAKVFSETAADILPDTTKVVHSIDIEEGKTIPYGPIYALSAKELQVLCEYLETSMAKGWIRRSKSPAGAPILFVPKKDGTLRLCVDYRGLNRITVKNRHPLPLIGETLDRLVGAERFTKLDLRNAYHRIRIREGDEWKTAFRTRYGHFEYLVMPFGLTNAPATFQAYINESLRGLLDKTCQAYMDDIIVYSFPGESHEDRVREVLERLEKASLFVNLSKCEFSTEEVNFLGYRVGRAGVSIDPDRVRTIQEWNPPASFRDIQVFVGFCNFYRRFIYRFSAVVAPLTNLLKGMQKGRKKGPFDLTDAGLQAFRKLQQCFLQAPLLQHFDPKKLIRAETDASGGGIAAILSQPADELDSRGRLVWKPVAFFSRKLIPAEQNYGTPDQEMLAIVEAFREWRHYLEAPEAEIEVLTDHRNLQSFMTTKALSRRQARWAETLAAYDFRIAYRKGSLNPADGPSRQPGFQAEAVNENLFKEIFERSESNACVSHAKSMHGVTKEDTLPGTVLVGVLTRSQRASRPKGAQWSTLPTAEGTPEPGEAQVVGRGRARSLKEMRAPYGKIPDALTSYLLSLQAEDAWCKEKKWKAYLNGGVPSGPHQGRWCEDPAGLVRCAGRVYVPNDPATRAEILRVNHDDPWQGGHFGYTRTLEVISRYYWWPELKNDVRKYCASCDICQRVKAPRHKPYGLLVPLPQPERPWQDISFDFITGLPPAMHGRIACDAILVVVDRFSKMVRYLPCAKDFDAPALASLLFKEVFSKFGFPRSIVSDRGSLFTSA